jgi:hypothetical protein
MKTFLIFDLRFLTGRAGGWKCRDAPEKALMGSESVG